MTDGVVMEGIQQLFRRLLHLLTVVSLRARSQSESGP
jgi:hypothetical protein